MEVVSQKVQDPEAASRLRTAGLRATSVRLAVLQELDRGGHTTADQVYRGVSNSLPETSLQAVYGALTALVSSGLARKVEPAGAAAHFEIGHGPQHHHLVCKSCGRIEDVPCAIGEAPCLTPSDDWNFDIESAEVTFWGTCAQCR